MLLAKHSFKKGVFLFTPTIVSSLASIHFDFELFCFCIKASFNFMKIIFTVKFRYVVFRPFVDEVLVGKIKSSSPEGVQGALHYLIDHQQYVFL